MDCSLSQVFLSSIYFVTFQCKSLHGRTKQPRLWQWLYKED